MASEPPFYGAYGLRLEGVEDAHDLLVEADSDWPTLRLAWRLDDDSLEHERVTAERAELRLRTGGRIEIDRRAGSATFFVRRPLSAEELVHPYLAPVAAVTAHWFGRESVHAGAFVAGGTVWGVVGARESGKSSTLARLALDGLSIVCDDMLVLDGTRVLAGPRSVDLRAEPAARLGAGEPIGIAGARERWRLRLGPVPRGLRIGGWIHLAWGERVEAVPVEGADRVARLLEERGARLPSLSPAVLLDLASLPSWEVRRPRRWETLRETADCLRELAGD